MFDRLRKGCILLSMTFPNPQDWTVADRREIARISGVCERTIQRYSTGARLITATRSAIESAARQLRLLPQQRKTAARGAA